MNLVKTGIERTSKGKKTRIKCKDCGKIMIIVLPRTPCPTCGITVRMGSTHGKISTDLETFQELIPCSMSGKFWDEPTDTTTNIQKKTKPKLKELGYEL
ncbi:MAG: hypothetical protein WC623_21745 [Pedobacter sp.]|uniref:hypothetical protein n=1 Tax=Pedobacter sp. TaxID=1411316 RepID=UPI00356A35CB